MPDDDNVPEEKFKKQAKKGRDLIASGEWPRGPVKGFPHGQFFATDAQKKASYPYENEEDDEEEPAPAPDDEYDDEDDDEDYSENIQAPDLADPEETQKEEVPYPSNEDEGEEERAIVVNGTGQQALK